MHRLAPVIVVLGLVVIPPEAAALITGGEGNAPLADPGWPKGAAVIFNNRARIAWWEGPPFGGGQWHAEYRRDAIALSAVLQDFAKLDVKSKRIVLHDGIGHSFWLAPNHEPEKLAAAKMDWVFMVWQPANWQRLRKLPADLNPTDHEDDSPPAQIDVYTGSLRWAEVVVPKGIELVDQRLEGHGFTAADGAVLEGTVVDIATKQPIAAKIRLERIETQQQGGYRYTLVAEASSKPDGHWVLKNTPAGWYRVVVKAPGFAPRVSGYVQLDEQPRWQDYPCGLCRSSTVSGRVTDETGAPLADVEVRLHNVAPASGGRYESPSGFTCKTNGEGGFYVDDVPVGKASIWVHKPGFCRPGLGEPITTPARAVELRMVRAAGVYVAVDFKDKVRPAEYIVSIEPEGGSSVGSFGGSGHIDANGHIAFKDVPPGRYVFRGQPNPSSGDQRSEPVAVDLKGGQTARVTIIAK
jgi:hypothetical protein